MLDHGADRLAFETIVATGPNSAVPHHRPTDRSSRPATCSRSTSARCYEGYHADCTRTFVVGAEPADWQREIYDLVRAAQRAGRHALAPGVDVAEVDAAARSVIADGRLRRRRSPTGSGTVSAWRSTRLRLSAHESDG